MLLMGGTDPGCVLGSVALGDAVGGGGGHGRWALVGLLIVGVWWVSGVTFLVGAGCSSIGIVFSNSKKWESLHVSMIFQDGLALGECHCAGVFGVCMLCLIPGGLRFGVICCSSWQQCAWALTRGCQQ